MFRLGVGRDATDAGNLARRFRGSVAARSVSFTHGGLTMCADSRGTSPEATLTKLSQRSGRYFQDWTSGQQRLGLQILPGFFKISVLYSTCSRYT
jgi:hypothetical protein